MTPEEQAEATRQVILRMEAALAANSNDMAAHFHDDFRWMGNRGCGTKHGLAAFRQNWQLPLRAAFTDRDYKTVRFICEGDWASCFGHIEATHSGEFMGHAPTGKRVTIPYMDFWVVRDGKIADNWVSVDFASVLAQLGEDIFSGRGWEHLDPDAPAASEHQEA
ncbi:ester cyclase [Maliponia aquimaris]|uniref:SnoaL-like polyketide cyclase n=1 Tax=Maliponia aquimaris TaxID=1673631 RepID=A0A238KUD3_9RHOB|nr:ester cyclase [Maliponia aquimaris]SMX46260.1 SnoaL-like polyketide cyclase [Maliponia aquimaris]